MAIAAPIQTSGPAPQPAAPTQQGGLDPTLKNLAIAIRQNESGGDPTAKGASGEYGAYQFTDGAWKKAAGMAGIKTALKDSTLEEQNHAAIAQLSAWKAAHPDWNIGNFASAWNAGEGEPHAYTGKFSDGSPATGTNKFGVKFDVPGYAKKIATAYQSLKANGGGDAAAPQNSSGAVAGASKSFQEMFSGTGSSSGLSPEDQASADQTGAFMPANTESDGPLGAAGKVLANFPGSAFNFVKGAFNTLNPINIVSNLIKAGQGFGDAATNFGGGSFINGVLPAAGSLIKNIFAPGAEDAAGNETRSLSNLGGFTQGALFKGALPEAVQGVVKGGMGAATGDLSREALGFGQAQRSLENDPVGQVLPIILAAEAGAKALDKTGVTGAAQGTMLDSEGQPLKTVFGNNQTFARGGAADMLDNGVSKVSGAITKPIGAFASKVGDVTGGMFKSGASKLTGLEPETMSTIAENPDAFSKDNMENMNRQTLGQQVQSALNKRVATLGETGEGYQPIRDLQQINSEVSPETTKAVKLGNGKSLVYDLKDAPNEELSLPELRKKAALLKETGTQGMGNNPGSFPELKEVTDLIKKRQTEETIPHQVQVSPAYLERSIKQTTGLTMQDGEFKTSGMAAIRDAKDIRALQNLYETWKPSFSKGSLTPDEFLNFRSDLAKMSRFDREVSKSAPLEDLAEKMRANFNENYRGKIPGLEALDEQFSTQKGELKELSRGLVDKDGNITDSGLSKIANLSKDKPNLAAQLEKLVPGIGKQVQILKAIRDIQKVAGPGKVGTYTKTAAGMGGLVGGIATGNIPLMAGSVAEMILTNPENATAIIRKYGSSKPLIDAVVSKLKQGATAINQLPQQTLPRLTGAFSPSQR